MGEGREEGGVEGGKDRLGINRSRTAAAPSSSTPTDENNSEKDSETNAER